MVAESRNIAASFGVTADMKRVTPTLLAVTLRIGLMVAFAMILILVLLPAALAAQAAGIR